MEHTEQFRQYASAHAREACELLEELGKIPAPSHHEDLRSAFCREWFEKNTEGIVTVDEAKNVLCSFTVDPEGDTAVVMAHMDVVFEDTTELPMRREGNILYAPGIGDDTANLVNLMMGARYISEHRDQLKQNLIIVANSCEEGLGNLDGCKQIFRDCDSITSFLSLDGYLGGVTCRPVGSHRYQITVKTQGGHSYGDYGRDNAIEIAARIIEALYAIDMPEDVRTTRNVGTIKGGSTVNSIAQECSLLYEYRSESDACLEYMKEKTAEVLESFRKEGKQVEAEILGIRPGMGPVDREKLEEWTQKHIDVVRKYYDGEVRSSAGSTDANIPLSMGIVGNTIGTISGKGAHTREEWVDLDSQPAGLALTLDLLSEYLK